MSRRLAHGDALGRRDVRFTIAALIARFKVTRAVKLASNETPFGASPRVIAALTGMTAATAGCRDSHCVALRSALGSFLDFPIDRIMVGNGSESLIELACFAFLNPGERVVTQAPCFGLQESFAKAMAARVDKVPFNTQLRFDVPAWRRALSKPVKIAVIANPSNPVGCRLDTGQFREVVQAAPEDTLLLIDETYSEFAQGTGFPNSLMVLAGQRRPWLVVRTFSKAYGLAGLRIGYGVASSADVVKTLDRVRAPFNLNAIAQSAAIAALTDQDHVRRSVQRIRFERQRLRQSLEKSGYAVAQSHANFLLFDCGEPASELAERLLERGVIVRPCRDAGYERFIRVTVGSGCDNEQFLAALSEVARR